MDAISASVIGGTLLSGGVGTPFGTVFGVLIKGTISSLITTQGTLSSWWVRIALSALLCFFIVLRALSLRIFPEIICRNIPCYDILPNRQSLRYSCQSTQADVPHVPAGSAGHKRNR